MTNITSDLVRLARSFFDLELPVSSVALKKAYHRRCLELHPDAGGEERDFKEMQDAYNTLTASAYVAEIFAGEEEYKGGERVTTCGTPLSELGLGLGPTTNGSDCPVCHHKGYYERSERFGVTCDRCNGSGREPPVSKCRACNGTGKFQQARSKRIVDCLRCGGSGRFINKRLLHLWVPCKQCHGSGSVRKNTSKKFYVKCERCGGTGENPIWNPVLPKAALT